MRLSLAGEINMLAHMLDRLSEKNRWYRDFTLNALTDAVREIIACFPVYRAYVGPDEEPGPADREAVLRAVRLAKRRNPGIERSIFNFLIGEVLLKKFPENIDDEARREHMRFVMKLQQCAGPVMAKGVEDTAFYIYNRLAALNEVGGEPGRFGSLPARFFEKCAARLKDHPHAMLATATHDTKRGEDTRARLAAISEFPTQWRKSLRRWQVRNRKFKRSVEGESAPSANEEYLLYQTLLGTWPLEPFTPEGRAVYVRRVQEYMIKALKEAKVNTSWIQPNEDWESAVKDFVAEILKEGPNRFLKDFEPFTCRADRPGGDDQFARATCPQEQTVPGVPDFYQGCGILWDLLSLVDPDKPEAGGLRVARERTSGSVENGSAVELFKQWRDGRIKMFLTRALLEFRRAHDGLFAMGDFVALRTSGTFAESCVAFARAFEGETLCGHCAEAVAEGGIPAGGNGVARHRHRTAAGLRRADAGIIHGASNWTRAGNPRGSR